MSTNLFEQYKAALRRGHMAALAGDLEEALAAYDAAAGLVPERALPLASRGTVLHRLDRWPEAAEAFDQALRLAPDDQAALRARATARAERGLRSGAAADFERLAFVLDVAGRSSEAADAARLAADLEPSPARDALADRLGAAAARMADLLWGRAAPTAPPIPSPAPEAAAEAATAGAKAASHDAPDVPLDAPVAGGARAEMAAAAAGVDPGAYDALEALRAGLVEDGPSDGVGAPVRTRSGPAALADAADAEAAAAEAAAAEAAAGLGRVAPGDGADQLWPGIDLPSPPPPPLEGPPPDPEELLAEAALVLESGEIEAARDLMLTAVRVHREAGRTDAALDTCLNLLSIAPGDPRVHLAIANLQLDRGWTGVASEKIDLLVRLTSLTGDTQAEADVHGLASERLRDDPAASAART